MSYKVRRIQGLKRKCQVDVMNLLVYQAFVCRVEKVMESFELYSAVRGYYVYRDVWQPSVGEKLVAGREFDNRFDKFAVKVLNGEETVGDLPCEYSRISWTSGIFSLVVDLFLSK